MIYVLLRHALQVTFVLCVLWQKKHPTFLRRWLQGHIKNCSRFLRTSCVSRLGKEERTESFPSLVTNLMPRILLCFLFLCLSNCICCLFGKWAKFGCNIYYASLVCIVLMMDRTNAETIVCTKLILGPGTVCCRHPLSGPQGAVSCASKTTVLMSELLSVAHTVVVRAGEGVGGWGLGLDVAIHVGDPPILPVGLAPGGHQPLVR